ncbi:hypothetical protein WICPIJ_009743 [Wickerhamomyces pijperi]|uniref:Uncharacterized protein n=1 Tax=Wickerhamomyces pijperi TaxID=599730 RepID=A0A9P8PLK1_WICPI|nr:hypothetical protein WICPIJ_009743 [Wickerhamomyces pijperi]
MYPIFFNNAAPIPYLALLGSLLDGVADLLRTSNSEYDSLGVCEGIDGANGGDFVLMCWSDGVCFVKFIG